MSIQQQVILRFRGPGHVRFALPAALCRPGAAERLVEGLRSTQGIYRVDLYRRQRKLAVRYEEETIGFRRLAATFAAVIAEIGSSPGPAGTGTGLAAASGAPAVHRCRAWAAQKAEEARETLVALRIVMREKLSRGLQASPERRQFFGEFLTDILVLYLIKTHWHLITQHWLKRPWQYRYEWMAALYMIYLLVSSKKPKP